MRVFRYVRSEAAAVIFLQRAADARRVYAHVVHARANTDGSKGEGVTFPSGAVQRQLLEEVYSHAGVSPLDVSYVEAHGTGTKVRLKLSDRNFLIASVFLVHRGTLPPSVHLDRLFLSHYYLECINICPSTCFAKYEYQMVS